MLGQGPVSSARRPAAGASALVSSLVAALDALGEATDAVAEAVGRHDLAALDAANGRAEGLVAEIAGVSSQLTAADRRGLEAARVAERGERLRAAARRNAHLIERAWAADAGLIRLLASLGQRSTGAGEYAPAEYAASEYGPQRPAAYFDREA